MSYHNNKKYCSPTSEKNYSNVIQTLFKRISYLQYSNVDIRISSYIFSLISSRWVSSVIVLMSTLTFDQSGKGSSKLGNIGSIYKYIHTKVDVSPSQ